MRLVLRQVLDDYGRLRRVVEIVLDVIDLRELGQLHDVERAVLEGDAVGAIEAGSNNLDLALAALVDDGIDLVEQPRPDEHRALVAERERSRIGHSAGIDLDLEALGRLEFVDRQLVRRGRQRRSGDRGELLGIGVVGPAEQRLVRRAGLAGPGWGRLLRGGGPGEKTGDGACKQHAAADGRACHRDDPP